jgi:hypothetical protein
VVEVADEPVPLSFGLMFCTNFVHGVGLVATLFSEARGQTTRLTGVRNKLNRIPFSDPIQIAQDSRVFLR